MKFRITATQIITNNFDTCDVEANDEAEAQDIVEKMIADGTLTKDSEEVEYDHTIEPVEEDNEE